MTGKIRPGIAAATFDTMVSLRRFSGDIVRASGMAQETGGG